VRRIDALRFKILDRRGSEKVLADARDHRHVGAAESRRHGLVGSLATPAEIEMIPEDRLSRFRKPVGECRQVHVRAADHCNP
jgi:hypothetical protein